MTGVSPEQLDLDAIKATLYLWRPLALPGSAIDALVDAADALIAEVERLTAENERLTAELADHAWTTNSIDQSLRVRAGVVTRYRHQRDEARAERDRALAAIARVEALAEWHETDRIIYNAINWRNSEVAERIRAALAATDEGGGE